MKVLPILTRTPSSTSHSYLMLNARSLFLGNTLHRLSCPEDMLSLCQSETSTKTTSWQRLLLSKSRLAVNQGLSSPSLRRSSWLRSKLLLLSPLSPCMCMRSVFLSANHFLHLETRTLKPGIDSDTPFCTEDIEGTSIDTSSLVFAYDTMRCCCHEELDDSSTIDSSARWVCLRTSYTIKDVCERRSKGTNVGMPSFLAGHHCAFSPTDVI